GINPKNGENIGAPTPASQFQSVLGFDSFNPGTNFHEQNTTNANGVVFFPGSTPLYKNGQLVGGFGVSGDGVDQDDDVTFVGGGTFIPQPGGSVVRADETFVRGVRLPYQKFSRNPHA
ncbi:MAG TPA: heme-binding protein, partial [Lacipirellulaceae bacterium]|nr:heme-binding protein [Lacipirellulaceae bacterium]